MAWSCRHGETCEGESSISLRSVFRPVLPVFPDLTASDAHPKVALRLRCAYVVLVTRPLGLFLSSAA